MNSTPTTVVFLVYNVDDDEDWSASGAHRSSAVSWTFMTLTWLGSENAPACQNHGWLKECWNYVV